MKNVTISVLSWDRRSVMRWDILELLTTTLKHVEGTKQKNMTKQVRTHSSRPTPIRYMVVFKGGGGGRGLRLSVSKNHNVRRSINKWIKQDSNLLLQHTEGYTP